MSLEVIDVVGTDRSRTLCILGGGRLFLIHFLAERAAVFDFCSDGSELLREVYFKKIGYVVKGDQKLILCVFFDLLDEEIVVGEMFDKVFEVDVCGEGHQELD